MIRLCLLAMAMAFFSCGSSGEGTGTEDDTTFTYQGFSDRFRDTTLPFILADSTLHNNKDTAALNPQFASGLMPDSVLKRLFPGVKKVKLIPLARTGNKEETYFILKAIGGARKAAVLITFDKDQKKSAAFPFLIPDADSKTSQISTLDKQLSISRTTIRKTDDEATQEGKDVHIYNSATGDFTLIMTDVLNEDTLALINPIDTLGKKNPLAGDYYRGKRNLVSVRDGRTPNEVQFFASFEADDDCAGEIKGTALFTSSKTAVYRQGGDPCVLELTFSGNNVALREVEGCGARRGLKCSFDGQYKKKAEPKPKTQKKPSKKKA